MNVQFIHIGHSAPTIRTNLAAPSGLRDTRRMTPADDRRHKRSNDPLIALHYQLAHARTEGLLEAIVVADDSGVVVAAAGTWAMCEELAAYAPLLAQGQWTEAGRDDTSRVAELRGEVDVQPVDVDGQTVLLCARARARARGGPSQMAAMDRAAEGVARILRVAA